MPYLPCSRSWRSDLRSRCLIRISVAPIAALTRSPASATGTEYRFWRTVTSALASTRTVVVSVASNGAGSARSSGRSAASCSATVTGRPAIRRPRSLLARVGEQPVELPDRPDRSGPGRGGCAGTGRPRPPRRPSRARPRSPGW